MMHNTRLAATLLACLTIFPNFTNAFWRLPCRGRLGVARLDPLMDPGEVASHAHTIHGAGSKQAQCSLEPWLANIIQALV
jgi:hypothetical protein